MNVQGAISSKQSMRGKTAGDDKRKELSIQTDEIEKLIKEAETLEEDNIQLKEAKGRPQVLPPIQGTSPPVEIEPEDVDVDKQGGVIEPALHEEEHKAEVP